LLRSRGERVSGYWRSVTFVTISDRCFLLVQSPSASCGETEQRTPPVVADVVTEADPCVCFVLPPSNTLHSDMWSEWRFVELCRHDCHLKSLPQLFSA
jgi:hypothetical protein